MNGKLYFAILAASLLATGCATTQDTSQPSTTPAAAPVTLTGDEIKSLISGRTGEGRTSEGYYVKAYNSPDGKISATSEKSRRATSALQW